VSTAKESGAMWLVMRHYPPIVSIQLMCLKCVMRAQQHYAAMVIFGAGKSLQKPRGSKLPSPVRRASAMLLQTRNIPSFSYLLSPSNFVLVGEQISIYGRTASIETVGLLHKSEAMGHHSAGLDNQFSPRKIHQPPRDLNPFYNENLANSDTSNCKK